MLKDYDVVFDEMNIKMSLKDCSFVFYLETMQYNCNCRAYVHVMIFRYCKGKQVE